MTHSCLTLSSRKKRKKRHIYVVWVIYIANRREERKKKKYPSYINYTIARCLHVFNMYWLLEYSQDYDSSKETYCITWVKIFICFFSNLNMGFTQFSLLLLCVYNRLYSTSILHLQSVRKFLLWKGSSWK